jgi:hypothetical protein
MQSVWSAKIFGDKEDPRLRTAEIFGSGDGLDDGQAAAAQWVVETLTSKGIDPKAELAAIAAPRREKPELTLRTAAYLVKRAIKSAA